MIYGLVRGAHCEKMVEEECLGQEGSMDLVCSLRPSFSLQCSKKRVQLRPAK